MDSGGFVLFLNGGYGVGKTSTLEHIGDELARRRQPFALMDVDWFHRSWPTATDDEDNTRVEAENMRAVWSNYRRTGPRQLVVSGVLRDRHDVLRYQQALELPIRAALLTATHATTEARLRARYTAERSDALDWHLARHISIADELKSAGCYDIEIPTDDRTPAQVARQVLEHLT